MLNMFEIFDPSTKWFSMNWMSSMLIIMFLPNIYWMTKFRMLFLYNYMMNILINEMMIILKNKFNMNNMLFLMVLFMFIMFNNLMGLFPYIFTSTSHLILSMFFSMSMWFGLMLFSWIKNMNFMFIHLTPLGTPFMLMFFMVLIEFLSNMIRPLTLGIRLVANMIAGHLLLTLLAMFIPNLIMMYMIIFLLQLMLLTLEIMVSLIQSYVFMILTMLYLKETSYE
uniref:ATP synthase subunit a n=1 Tax=Proterops sp. QL-2014 TaxID=1491724 RepID=A0A0U1WEK0_9HYME|nr:ATP synthase F0 subunit 6 [Proterops sp. QL-2014]